MPRWSCLGLKISFLDLVTIGWDGCFGPNEHASSVKGDEPKVYNTSWLDGGEDSVDKISFPYLINILKKHAISFLYLYRLETPKWVQKN